MQTVYTSATNRWVAGVFGGLGEYFDIDPNILRLTAIFLGVATGFIPLVVAYIVAWLVIPEPAP